MKAETVADNINHVTVDHKEKIERILSSIKKMDCVEEKEQSLDLLLQLSHLVSEKSDINKNVVITLKEAKRQCSVDPELVNYIDGLLKKLKQIFKGAPVFRNLKDTPILPKKRAASSEDINDTTVTPTSKAELPEGRQKIVAALQHCLESNIDNVEKSEDATRNAINRAANLSLDIECEIDRHHPFSSNVHDYQAKTRQIYSDLKKNKVWIGICFRNHYSVIVIYLFFYTHIQELQKCLMNGKVSTSLLVEMPKEGYL